MRNSEEYGYCSADQMQNQYCKVAASLGWNDAIRGAPPRQAWVDNKHDFMAKNYENGRLLALNFISYAKKLGLQGYKIPVNPDFTPPPQLRILMHQVFTKFPDFEEDVVPKGTGVYDSE